MLSYKDCRDFCEFEDDEIAAVAEHEHLPRMLALAYAEHLIHKKDGVPALKKILQDDIAAAQRRYDHVKVKHLHQVLEHFVLTHPEPPKTGGVTFVND